MLKNKTNCTGVTIKIIHAKRETVITMHEGGATTEKLKLVNETIIEQRRILSYFCFLYLPRSMVYDNIQRDHYQRPLSLVTYTH